MVKNSSEREIVSKNFNFLRILQQETSAKINVERVKENLNVSRTTADVMKEALVKADVINKKLAINPKYATFWGVSISYSEIEISIVGMNGKEIP